MNSPLHFPLYSAVPPFSVPALSSLPLVFCIVAITGASDTHRPGEHKERERERTLCLVLWCRCAVTVLSRPVWSSEGHPQTHTHTWPTSQEKGEWMDSWWRMPPTCHTDSSFDRDRLQRSLTCQTLFFFTEFSSSKLFTHLFCILNAPVRTKPLKTSQDHCFLKMTFKLWVSFLLI